ncbi:SCO family protein [uncultured Croceitalea sp.]|uniref:SCO family protein n=1 Tax=uncultured Croceitalea sp. TaxID=1798908 RepID=UPI0033065953
MINLKMWLFGTSKIRMFLMLMSILFTGCKKEIRKEKMVVKETSRVKHLPYYNDESFTPHWLTPNSEEERQFHKIPDFKLINQLGDTVTQKTFEDKLYITDFFFTSCPGICSKMTQNMTIVQKEFIGDPEVLLLSHSVTPSIDSVTVLKAYAERNDIINAKWHLVTGDKMKIYDLGRNQYFVENDLGIPKDFDNFLHSENFLLIDKNKHIRGIYNGLNKTSIKQLITDVKTLKKER